MTIQIHAVRYSLHAWHPLAVRPDDKRPLITGWQSTSLDVTLDAISASPGANVGIAIPAGFMVLDVDTKSDGPATLTHLVAMNSELPDTLTATTPSGGKHIWLALPPGVVVGNRVAIAPGLDIRTLGGYVVAPPSVINGAEYRWDNWDTFSTPVIADAPGWLLALVSRPKKPIKVTSVGDFTIPDGQRNRTLFEGGAAMRAKGFSFEAIADALVAMNERSCNPPLGDEEVMSIAASVCRYAPETPLWEIFAEPGALPAGALPVGSAQASPMRYKLLSGADLCNAPPMRWIVRGVLPQEGLAALYGASGSGKSFLILDIGYAVAGGDCDWFGRRVTQAPVTYVCLEGEAGTGKRVKAWSMHHNKAVPDALRFITQPFNLLSDDVADLAKAVIAVGGERGLVILDTLNRAAPGADENSSVDMGKLIAAAKLLQNLTGGLVLLVHHTGKDSTKGLRGHSSLYAALDGAIEVTATGSIREWSVAKSKDDVTGDAHPFRLESVSVGEEDDGEPITSCVAVSDDSREVIKKRKPKLCANQKIAYDVLTALLPTPPGGALIAKPHIDYDNAVDAVSGRMPAEAKDRKGRAKAAISGLVSHDYVVMRDDQLWLN